MVGKDGETGLLVTPDDPGALAAAISRILDDPELGRRLGSGGRERVLGRFTWHATAAGTAEHYQLTLEDHKRQPGRPPRLTAKEFVGFGGSAVHDVSPPPAAVEAEREAAPC